MTPAPSLTTLPELSAEEQRYSARAAAAIGARIEAAGGWLPFSEYMQLALYAPGTGYYTGGATKLGEAGDFVTASEVSDLFAVTLAGQFAELLSRTGGSVLELGAGSGRFAATVLRELAHRDCLPQRYALFDLSAELRARQRDTIAMLAAGGAARAISLDRLPERFTGIVFANEVMDAIPCERFVIREGQPRRLGVVCRAAGFAWAQSPAPAGAMEQQMRTALGAHIDALPEGYVGEYCAALQPWIADLAARLEHGVLLLADYGLPRSALYLPERAHGTLRCYFRHRAHDDPFVHPGLTDISAWVDFTAVAGAARDCGLDVSGFATQAAFLLGGGIEAALSMPDHARLDAGQLRAAGELRRLLLPGELGESVKFIALTRGDVVAPSGFRLQDLRYSLGG